MRAIGIFGGTFDPIHYGHLRTAFELLRLLALDEVRFIPTAYPPHRRTPRADAALRLRMLLAATAAEAAFVVDERELRRGGASYTIDTLRSLRDDFPDAAICMILGMDAFLGLPSWKDWQQLLDLAHIVVAHRPGWQAPAHGSLGDFVSAHLSRGADELSRAPAGRVHIEEVTQLEISSTHLRATMRAGIEAKYLMPDSVWNIINETGCYAKAQD
jgi:nicotinate-nucleotide adenylyltransferase